MRSTWRHQMPKGSTSDEQREGERDHRGNEAAAVGSARVTRDDPNRTTRNVTIPTAIETSPRPTGTPHV